MVRESAFETIAFGEWLGSALIFWVTAVVVLLVVGLLFGWLVPTLRWGPAAGSRIFLAALREGVLDWLRLSPRRVWALAVLTFKESVRRRVVAVFALFLAALLFAGWFLDPESPEPAKLYLTFVLSTTSYLVLLLALFLSALGLPGDISRQTLHTVVTKPVRRCEIILGRVLGYTGVGTALLALMGTMCYVFVVRGVAHTHELSEADLETLEKLLASPPSEAAEARTLTLRTSRVNGHRHTIYLDPRRLAAIAEGAEKIGELRLATEPEHGHVHEITIRGGDRYVSGGKSVLSHKFGGPEGLLIARVPRYGKLRFKDRAGNDSDKGINVGDEWTYRSYIEGGTLAAAIWTFTGISERDFPDGLPVEMTLGVFRTHKGEIDKGVPGSLAVRSPATGELVEVRIFESREFVADRQFIPRVLRTRDGRTVDLFRDLAADGRVEIWIRCAAPHQCFGMAQPDLYLRAGDASFAVNFFKGYFGIWMQMVLIIGFGVMFGTFLSAPIAWVATLAALAGGLFSEWVGTVAQHPQYGGGPIESMYRLALQQNMTSPLEPGTRTTVMQMIDTVLERGLMVIWCLLPDLTRFDFAKYVSSGFDVSGDLLLKNILQTAAFLLPVGMLGYWFLKTREVGQ